MLVRLEHHPQGVGDAHVVRIGGRVEVLVRDVRGVPMLVNETGDNHSSYICLDSPS